MSVRLRVAGACRVEGTPALGRRDRIVLAALAAASPVPLSAEGLAEALWGDDPPPTWRKVVHGSVSRLRQILGQRAIETAPDGYVLTLGDDDVDVRRFERLVQQADELIDAGQAARASSLLREGLLLVKGTPFLDLEDWPPGQEEASRLSELVRHAQERLVVALLADGRVDDAASVAGTLVTSEPLREQRWVLLAQALYACDRQAEALRAIDRARRTLRDELGVEPGPALVAVERSVLHHDPGLRAERRGPAALVCPYKGLAAYDIDDADTYFGRDADIEACVARLLTTGVLAIVGPSGSGKSSLARAGIGPVIRRRGQPVAVMTPGPDPVGRLAALDRTATVIVDQLEELFTGATDRTVQLAFGDALARRSITTPVVLILRADFVGAASTVGPLAELVERGLHLLGPMSEEQLREAITLPATGAGLGIEPGLVDVLVRDVEGQVGALPLVSHALAETWVQRDGRILTVAGYRSTGGVNGAVAATADQVLDRLPAESRQVARSLFLRLVSLSDGGAPTSHRIARSDLSSEERHVEVLDALLRARLLTADTEAVQVAHEAIGRAWPRLRSWLEEDREGQRILLHLSGTAAEWVRTGNDDAELYRGSRLQAVEEWIESTQPDLTAVELAFLDASRVRRQAEEDDLAAQAAEQRRANRRLRLALAGVGALLTLALIAGSVAVVQQRRAVSEQRAASMQALVSDSGALRSTRRDLAALLAIEAYRLDPGPSAESALLGAVAAAPSLERTVRTEVEHHGDGILVDDSTLALMDNSGTARLVDLETGVEVRALPVLDEPETGVIWSARSDDGRYLATAWRSETLPDRGVVTVWDLSTGERRFSNIDLDFLVGSVDISADGSLVAVAGGINAVAQVYDAATGTMVAEVEPLARPDDAVFTVNTVALHFTPGGGLLVGSQAGPIRRVDPLTGREINRIDGPPQTSEVLLHVSSDGSTLTTGGFLGLAQFDLESGAPTWAVPPADGFCTASAVVELQGVVLCDRGLGGQVVAYDLQSGAPLGPWFETNQDVCSLIVSTDGARLVSTSCYASDYQIWRLDGSGGVQDLPPGPLSRPQMVVAHWGDRLVVEELDSNGGPLTTIVDLRTGERTPLPGVWGPVRTDRANVVGAAFDDGTVGWVDLTTAQRLGPAVDLWFDPFGGVSIDGVSYVWGSSGWDFGDGRTHLTAFDEATGDRTGLDLVLPLTNLNGVSVLDSERLVTVESRIGSGAWAQLRDAASGEPIGDPVSGVTHVVARGEVVVASARDGRLEVLDPTTLATIGAPFPGGTSPAVAVSMSDDGRRVAVLGRDGSLRLYDVPSRTQLGDPIAVDEPDAGIALSPDGGELAMVGRQGLVIWDLDPNRARSAACLLAGRNLTRAEWDRHIGDLAPYRRTCPNAPR